MSKQRKAKFKGNTLSGSADDIKNILDRAAQIADSPFTITGGQLKAEFCNYSYDLKVNENVTDSIKRKSGVLVHDDMKAAFRKLNAHLAVICEEIPADEISDIDKIPAYDPEDANWLVLSEDDRQLSETVSLFDVTAFSIDGVGENEGVVLTGTKRLTTGDQLELKAPKTTWTGQYAFVNELRVAIDDLKHEVNLYREGKAAPMRTQPELDFPEDSDPAENE